MAVIAGLRARILKEGSTLRLRTLTAAGIAAVAAALTMSTTPVSAGATTITDADGVDFDAGCLVGTSVTPPGPNSIGSPGAGCTGVSTYDGSTLASDLTQTQASFGSSGPSWPGCLVACMHLHWRSRQASLPAAGSTVRASLDLPNGSFVGVTYFTLFQNANKQTNVDNPSGGCVRIGGTGRVRDQRGSWKDGYHTFLAYNINWDGEKWVHAAHVGEYDPSPDGAFFFTELGTNDGGGWVSADVQFQYNTDWIADFAGNETWIWVKGIGRRTDNVNCHDGVYKTAYMETGDVIRNVKSLATVNQVVTLPVTVPLSDLCAPSGGEVCESDIRSLGGFVFFSDTTSGNSTAGLANSNITGIAYSGGAVGVSDTLGDGPTCPTPTIGGTLPPNPLFTPDTACQIDDDGVSRGSFLSEWWDTAFGYTA